MYLYEEIYFDITVRASRPELDKFADFLTSGELDEFFEISRDYINFDDAYENSEPVCEIVFTNDEIGIELDEFDVDEFLDVFCKAAKSFDVSGTLYDIDDNEYSFKSPRGTSEYAEISSAHIIFNDELDEAARVEEEEEQEEEQD